jgi:hypothetical protein
MTIIMDKDNLSSFIVVTFIVPVKMIFLPTRGDSTVYVKSGDYGLEENT